MSEHNGILSISIAIHNAADDAERAEMTPSADSSQLMQAIFLQDHVKVGAFRQLRTAQAPEPP